VIVERGDDATGDSDLHAGAEIADDKANGEKPWWPD
jgi:hypothetical protein